MLAPKAMSSKLKQYYKSLSCMRGERKTVADCLATVFQFLLFGAPEDLAVFHYELHGFQRFDVMNRIAADRDNVRERSWRNGADLSIHVEHDGGARRCALNSIHRRHTKFRHVREFLRDRFGPRDPAHVSSEHYLDASLKRLFE